MASINDIPTQNETLTDARTVTKFLDLWGDQDELEIIRECNLSTKDRWYRVRHVLLESKKIATVIGKPNTYTLLVSHD